MKRYKTQAGTARTPRSMCAAHTAPNRSALAIGIRAMLVAGGLLAAPSAWANCTTVGTVTTCDSSAPNPWTSTISSGGTVMVGQGAIINISGNGDGIFLSGYPGTIVVAGEVRTAGLGSSIFSNGRGTLTVERTGEVVATGATAFAIVVEPTDEEILIRNDGLIQAAYAAMEISANATSAATIENYGTIVGGTNRAFSNASTTATVDFRNRTGGVVEGDVVFNAANDFAYLYTGSSLTGDLSAGTGTDSLVLAGTGNETLSNAVEGAITGFESLTKTGAGALMLGGNTNVAGTHVAEGTLGVMAGAQLVSPVTVDAGAFFGGNGSVVGNVDNAGTLAIGSALAAFATAPTSMQPFMIDGNLVNRGMVTMIDGVATSAMSVLGTYVAEGGELHLEAILDDGSAPQADVFQVGAAELGGAPTGIVVHSLGGTGAPTVGDGIQVVQVTDATRSDPGAFTLSQRVVNGAYEYMLFQGGVADPADGNWYLRSEGATHEPLWRPEIGGYIGNRVAATNTLTHQLYDRPRSTDPWRSTWVRIVGENLQAQALDGAIDARGGRSLFQMGSDIVHLGEVQLGGMLAYSRSDVDVDVVGNPAHARAETEGAIAGVYASWFANGPGGLGAYLDSWAQVGRFDNTVRGDTLLPEEYDSDAWAVSGEFGYAIPLSPTWAVEPQGQVVFSKYSSDDVREANGTSVVWEDENDTVTRVGVRLRDHGEARVVRPYFQLDWWHGAGTPVLDFGPTELQGGVPKDRYEATAGLQAQLGPRTALTMRIQGEWGKHDYSGIEGQVGFQTRW